jgi:predicted nucleotidyltransferase
MLPTDLPTDLRDAVVKLTESPHVQGVLLVGSRSRGFHATDADYDLEAIVDDEFHHRLDARNRIALVWDGKPFESRLIGDIYTEGRSAMEAKAHSLLDVDHWPYESAPIWYDRDGEMADLVARLGAFPEAQWVKRLNVHHVDFWYHIGRARKIAERTSRLNYSLVLTRAVHAYIKVIFVLNRRWAPLIHWAEQSLAQTPLPLRPADDVATLQEVLTTLKWEPLQALAESLLPLLTEAGNTLHEDRLHQFLTVLSPEWSEEREKWSRY